MRLLTSIALFSSLVFWYSEAAILCGRGFTLVNNRCIRIFPNNMKHREAETDCTYLGGTLVNIKNSIDNRAIANRAANAGIQTMWIGVFCFASNTTNCYYDDASGAASNYTNFAPGFPQVDGNYGGCVYMTTSNGQWNSARCDVIGMPFVCEVPYTMPDDCTHNYNGYCYYPSTELGLTTVNTTHDKAQSICASKSMNLVSIHSKMEHDYIRSIYRMATGPVNVTQIYLGATAFLPDTFDWDDMTNWDFDYMNPLASHGKGNCLVMDVSGVGLWTEVSCQTANYFMCKRKAGATTTDAPLEEMESGPVARSSKRMGKIDSMIQLDRDSDPFDFSHCNSSLIMAPGTFTSPGYPVTGVPSTACTYALRALGPYKIAIYFTDFDVNYNRVDVYDENHNQLGSYSYQQRPFVVMAPSNIVTINFVKYQFQNSAEHGFSATFMPYS